jgi:hypothetical protein
MCHILIYNYFYINIVTILLPSKKISQTELTHEYKIFENNKKP